MNFPKTIATIVVASLLFVGCKDKEADAVPAVETEATTPKVKKEIAAANLQTANFTIKGMTCPMGCAKTIEEELNAMEGVQTATVDFEKESATVSYDKTIVTPEALTKVVEATADGKSYTVSDMKL